MTLCLRKGVGRIPAFFCGALVALVFLSARADTSVPAMQPSMLSQMVKPTPISGLYEVTVDNEVFYTDVQGRYLFVGHIYDLNTNIDLTAVRLGELGNEEQQEYQVNYQHKEPERVEKRFDISAMPAATLVSFGKGDAELYVLFDLHCGWCRRLYPELRQMTDTRVHLVVYPALGNNDTAARVLCEKQPLLAIDHMLNTGADIGEQQPAACLQQRQSDFSQLATLVRDAGLYGTPILMTKDGRTHAGYLPENEILAWLNQPFK